MQVKIVRGSLDLGYGWVKALTGSKRWVQPAVLGETRQLFDEDIQPGDTVYKGQEGDFFIGDLAVRHSDVRYAGTKDSKAQTWTTKILLKAALGSLAPTGYYSLVTGLPIDYYFKQRGEMAELLDRMRTSGSFELQTGKQTELVRPLVGDYKIVPQPLGSAMDYLLDNRGQLLRKDEARRRLLVIDLGYYTLDLLVLDAMEVGKDSSSPPGLGVSTAYKLLRQYLNEKVGKAPAAHELDRYVIAGEYEGYNIQPLIEKAFKALADSIQLQVASLNSNFYRCILTGGAAAFVAPYLDLPNLVLLDDPQLGNVRGYEKIGARAWGL